MQLSPKTTKVGISLSSSPTLFPNITPYRNSVGVVDVSYRSRHQLTGDDRAKFLHRIISNDIESLSARQGAYAMLLTHRGKIIADLNIYVLEDAITIDTAPETAKISSMNWTSISSLMTLNCLM